MHNSNAPYVPLQNLPPARGSSLGSSANGGSGGGGGAIPRERQSSSPLLGSGSDSPRLMRSSSADNFHPSPPMPIHSPRQPEDHPSFYAQQQVYYDTPLSPGLPPQSPSYFATQQAAGVPLPPSPFSSHFPDSPYDRPASSFSAAGPDPAYRGSFFTDAGANPFSDGGSTRRGVYPSGTPSPLGEDGLAGGLPTLGYFNASAASLRPASYQDRNESSVWAPDDADEKGFYSSIGKGAALDETPRPASRRSKRTPWSKKRWFAVISILVLRKSRPSNSEGRVLLTVTCPPSPPFCLLPFVTCSDCRCSRRSHHGAEKQGFEEHNVLIERCELGGWRKRFGRARFGK